MKSSLEVLAHHTGQTVEKISADTDRDFVMTAHEAKEYGIIDEVIKRVMWWITAGRSRPSAEVWGDCVAKFGEVENSEVLVLREVASRSRN